MISAVRAGLKINSNMSLMQCNTNYMGRMKILNLLIKCFKTYSQLFPDLVLGLSDHTVGHSTTLGAIAIARL